MLSGSLTLTFRCAAPILQWMAAGSSTAYDLVVAAHEGNSGHIVT